MATVTIDDIEQLLSRFSKKQYKGSECDEASEEVHQRCADLFEKDYRCCQIENDKGSLSANYPSTIIIPAEKSRPTRSAMEILNDSVENSSSFDIVKIKEIVSKANLARCRTRFPVPVILYEGKFVCRSGTLASGSEMIIRDIPGSISTIAADAEENLFSQALTAQICSEMRSEDIKLLKELSVGYICDLMVENKKTKYLFLKITSSEKVDKEKRYRDFQIVQLPYPGCEFFRNYKDRNYDAHGLMFNWDQNYIDAKLSVPSDSFVSKLGINWADYKNWDLMQLTQNYMKLIIAYLTEGTSSILVHCISGWDRTPLFISLLRISLWADGMAHQSLNEVEIAYLTLAYDWYLFGHDLPTRLRTGQDIMFFCFDFLKYMISEEYSSNKKSRRISGNSADCPLGVLMESSSVQGLSTSNSSSSIQSQESIPCSSTVDTSLDNAPPVFFPTPDVGGELESPKAMPCVATWDNSSQDSHLSEETLPLAEYTNNNGSVLKPLIASSSSPVPVPSCRKRMDSTSSIGSWQYISAACSPGGSANAKGASNFYLQRESSEVRESPSSTQVGRSEKLKEVRKIMQRAYVRTINIWEANSEKSLFAWRR